MVLVVVSLVHKDRSRRVVAFNVRLSRTSSLQLLDNDLGSPLAFLLLKPHDLSNNSSWFGNRAFPLLLGLRHQCIICFCDVGLRSRILSDLLSPPASLDGLSIGALNSIRELLRIDRTRQNVWRSNNQEADCQCSREESTSLARTRVKSRRHGPGVNE